MARMREFDQTQGGTASHMKHLYIIGGTMGVGKTTVCQKLKKILPNCVFLDGDWCWDADPFQVTPETKTMVIDNITYLLNNFLYSSAYDNIVFCWVMHDQSIIDTIKIRLDTRDARVHLISLIADEESIRQRLMGDIQKGIRTPDVIERSLARLPLYQSLQTKKIDTTGKTVEEIAKEIVK